MRKITELENDHYKICLRHMRKKDNVFMFWGENNSGYSKCIENSGLYQKTDFCLSKQIKEGDFLVHKTIIAPADLFGQSAGVIRTVLK